MFMHVHVKPMMHEKFHTIGDGKEVTHERREEVRNGMDKRD
jgi:hypothetical protein